MCAIAECLADWCDEFAPGLRGSDWVCMPSRLVVGHPAPPKSDSATRISVSS